MKFGARKTKPGRDVQFEREREQVTGELDAAFKSLHEEIKDCRCSCNGDCSCRAAAVVELELDARDG